MHEQPAIAVQNGFEEFTDCTASKIKSTLQHFKMILYKGHILKFEFIVDLKGKYHDHGHPPSNDRFPGCNFSRE